MMAVLKVALSVDCWVVHLVAWMDNYLVVMMVERKVVDLVGH